MLSDMAYGLLSYVLRVTGLEDSLSSRSSDGNEIFKSLEKEF